MNKLLRTTGIAALALFGSAFFACTSADPVNTGGSSTTTTECTAGVSEACTTTAGKDGVRQCSAAGAWGDCLDCKDGDSQSCSSACGTGTEVCVGGKWMNCTAKQPESEICDGLDNDCNGQIDEVCTCIVGAVEDCYEGAAPSTKGVGTCKAGQHVCEKNGVASKWGPCLGQVLPATEENCGNQLDDDCNGKVNDGCACTLGTTQKCGSDVGECKQGTQTCQNVNGTPTWGDCANEVKPKPETATGCDGLDNDCNGQVDDGLPNEQGEPNESCPAAFILDPVANDGNEVTFTKMVYPAGDVDWLKFKANESVLHLCTPGKAQCQLLTLEIVQPGTAGVSYELSAANACTSPTLTLDPVTSGQHTLAWAGYCGLDDSKDIYLKVASAATATTKSSCEPYTIKATFETQDVNCCTLVACTGASDPVCGTSGCGACGSNGFCTP